MKRALLASSSHSPWFENPDMAEHIRMAPYSIEEIFYHLERDYGWAVKPLGWPTTSRPFRFARTIDAFQPDVIYTYGAMTALLPLFCRRYLCNWKSFRIVHGWDDAYENQGREFAGWVGSTFFNILEKQIVTRSDAVVTLSHFLKNRGTGWGVDCHYIPNGADPVEPPHGEPLIKLGGRFKLVYTGDQARWKRTADICEAMRHVPKDIKLYLTGRHYAYLDPYASDNCIFLGYVSKAEQYAVMSQADCFVCTADQDCNAKIQEYLRWGKPYLGYDGQANLFFKNRHNAYLTRDYVSAIFDLADHPVLRAELARNAKAEIPVYSWHEVAAKFDEYFKGLL